MRTRERTVNAAACLRPCAPAAPRTPRQVSGTLQAGTLRPGQKLLLLPGAETVHVKAVHSRGVAVTLATAGDHVEVTPTYPPTHPNLCITHRSTIAAGIVLHHDAGCFQ